MAEGYHQVVDM